MQGVYNERELARLTEEERQIIDYLEAKVLAYGRAIRTNPEYADDYKTSQHTVAVLVSDLRAGLHHPAPPEENEDEQDPAAS